MGWDTVRRAWGMGDFLAAILENAVFHCLTENLETEGGIWRHCKMPAFLLSDVACQDGSGGPSL